MAKLELEDVTFRALGVGKQALGLSFQIPREKLSLAKVDKHLIGARCSVKIVAKVDEDPEQGEMFPGAELESVADVNRISVGVDDYTGRLSFRKPDVDEQALFLISNRPGKLTLERVGKAGGKDDG